MFWTTEPLRAAIVEALPERPFHVTLWDGTRVSSSTGDGPTFLIRSPRAIAHVLRSPGELGIGRAYVTGLLDVDDIDAAMLLVDEWQEPEIDIRARLLLMAAAVRAMGLVRPPRRPASELVLRGRRHTVGRDARAVRHHYDVANEFFELFLDRSMTYSCAIFSSGAQTLEEAQAAKLELVSTKLALTPGQRVLDVGCGWGSFAIHAASRHGVGVVGITLSEPQARVARERAEAAGLGDRVEIRVMDYRELPDERFDAIASIGMIEHVGENQVDAYARVLARLLKPGGRLLNHGIAYVSHTDTDAGDFSERYVWPDAAPLQLSLVLGALERAGFVTRHVEDFPLDYARTLAEWTARLDDHLDEALALVGPDRLRVWRLYLRAARIGFETGFTSVYQARCELAVAPATAL
ncbi:MAG: cyclopropane-fatty-acyl-phospholipid synthase family protein [Actinomycetota bacterium]|nr:cyclopropane-fatty-acyl-phospholipid synthase family protein [Actinomycetota bacterium]